MKLIGDVVLYCGNHYYDDGHNRCKHSNAVQGLADVLGGVTGLLGLLLFVYDIAGVIIAIANFDEPQGLETIVVKQGSKAAGNHKSPSSMPSNESSNAGLAEKAIAVA